MKSTVNNKPARGAVKRGAGGAALPDLAPLSNWRGMSETDHFVQFYEADSFLLGSVGSFIGEGLSAGDGCIVVATKAHREGLEARLQAAGLELAAAAALGQYVSLDADEALSHFMVDGSPDPTRFVEVFGGVVSRAAAGRRGVRAFGEMVARLWAEGNYDAALRLEELWNCLRETRRFSLFCAYPMKGFGGEALAGRLTGVCAGHSRVIPDESYTAVADSEQRLRAIVQLQQKAKTLEAEVAERKRVEEALRAVKDELEVQLVREQMARAEAEAANRMKDEFLATVSHELRTPLNAIIGWSHMLSTGMLDEGTVTRAVETIQRNARSQARLVEDILDVSRMITGKLRLNVAPTDVAAVINAAIDSVQLAADSKGVQLSVRLDPSARRISGDATRLQQVVWNLLSNAIKFTPPGGRVEVRLERAGADAQIRVSDTGSGISEDFLPFIFDHFRQADGTSTRRHGGLGLGLAIVRHLVELHGGTIRADSPGEGLGSTFTVKLPLAVAKARTGGRRPKAAGLVADEAVQAGPPPSLDGVRVLLIDDDQGTRKMLEFMLAEFGATVQTAASAAEALEVFEWYRPDVLLSDLAMPDEDGYSLISKVREMERSVGRQTPAVALTAYVRVEDRARALSAGFNMFVPKPIEPDELITAIASLADRGAV